MIFQNCHEFHEPFTRLTAREITYTNSEISPVVFMPNITTNYAITYTNNNNNGSNNNNKVITLFHVSRA